MYKQISGIGIEHNEESKFTELELESKKSNRRTRVRGQISDLTPYAVKFAAQKTFKTPTRNVKKAIENGGAEDIILERYEKCIGVPLRILPTKKKNKKGVEILADNRKKCIMCGSKTQWFCCGCRAWYCMDHEETSQRKGCSYFIEEADVCSTSKKRKTIFFGKSCFHAKHENSYIEFSKVYGISGK